MKSEQKTVTAAVFNRLQIVNTGAIAETGDAMAALADALGEWSEARTAADAAQAELARGAPRYLVEMRKEAARLHGEAARRREAQAAVASAVTAKCREVEGLFPELSGVLQATMPYADGSIGIADRVTFLVGLTEREFTPTAADAGRTKDFTPVRCATPDTDALRVLAETEGVARFVAALARLRAAEAALAAATEKYAASAARLASEAETEAASVAGAPTA